MDKNTSEIEEPDYIKYARELQSYKKEVFEINADFLSGKLTEDQAIEKLTVLRNLKGELFSKYKDSISSINQK